MKKIFLLIILLFSFVAYGQEKKEKRFYTFSVYGTVVVNENYVLFDKDDGENLLEMSGVFIRNGMGYQFHRRFVASINFGIDFHTRIGMQSIPGYFNVQYNIWENKGNQFHVNCSIGKLWQLSSDFDNGNYYSVGFGWQFSGDKRRNTIFKLDYHRKEIEGFENGVLDSVSLAIGMTLF